MIIKNLNNKIKDAKINAPCVVQLSIDGEPIQFPVSDVIVRDRMELGVNQVVFIVPHTFYSMESKNEQPTPTPNGPRYPRRENELHPSAKELKIWMEHTNTSSEAIAKMFGISKNSVDSWLVGRWGVNSINQAKIEELITSEIE